MWYMTNIELSPLYYLNYNINLQKIAFSTKSSD